MSEENKTVFDLNDRVSAFGVEGVVVSVEYDYQGIYPIRVKFINGQYKDFTIDGKYESWHLEPSLKLIEKAKKKAKKKVKKKFCILISDNQIKSKELVTMIYSHSSMMPPENSQIVEIELEVEE